MRKPRWFAPTYGATISLIVVAAGLMGAGYGIAAWVLMIVVLITLFVATRAASRASQVRARVRGPRVISLVALLGVLLLTAYTVAQEATSTWHRPWLVALSAVLVAVAGAIVAQALAVAWDRDNGVR
jgi:cytochrome bd-type quinol oxidase subunit 2